MAPLRKDPPDSLVQAQREQLTKGLETLSIALDAFQIERLLGYLRLLATWNRAYNLTAVRDPLEHVGRHLLDSLSVVSHIHGQHVLDVGTGAGLPGLPLSIALPDKRWYLLDSNGKRVRFLTQCVLELQLSNVVVVHSRVENWKAPATLDVIISRAFSSLGDMVRACDGNTGVETSLLAMKARIDEKEVSALPRGYGVEGVIALKVPGSAADRQLVVVKRSN